MATISIKALPASPTDKTPNKTYKQYTIEKKGPDNKLGRYLCGVISGIGIDAHGERMSEECVKDFIDQFNTKDITLYENHGRNFSEDIGKATYAELLPSKDVYMEFKLCSDPSDPEFPRANKIWNLANGFPPYKFPRELGFSIEGIVDEKDVKWEGVTRVLNKVDLDPGVSLVPKPAYQSSVANAITKALGKNPKYKEESNNKNTENELNKTISARKETGDFFESLEELDDALDETENRILTSPDDETIKEVKLRDAFQKWMDLRMELFRAQGFTLSNLFPNDPSENNTQGMTLPLEGLDQDKEQPKSPTKQKESKQMDGELKTMLANVQALLEQIAQIESAEPEEVMESAKAEPTDEKPVDETAKQLKSAKKRMLAKALKLLAKADEMAEDETKKEDPKPEDETEKAEGEEEEVKELLKELAEVEGAGGGDMTAEDELEEVQPAQEQIDELKKMILKLSRTQKSSKKESPSLKALRQLVEMRKSQVKPNKGFSNTQGQKIPASAIEKALQDSIRGSETQKPATIREASILVKSIFGGK